MTKTATKSPKKVRGTMFRKNPHIRKEIPAKPQQARHRQPHGVVTEPGIPAVELQPAKVIALAKPGMAVEFMYDSFGPWYGTILTVSRDGCLVRVDRTRGEGERGEGADLVGLEWDNVLLADVRPDPAELAGDATPASRPAIAHPTDQPAQAGLAYDPHLRNWHVPTNPATNECIDSHTFPILDVDPATLKAYGQIGTLTINRKLSAEAAEAIARLIAHAPELFQELREQTRWQVLRAGDGIEDFSKAGTLLWEASARVPFAAPELSEDDDVYRARNEETMRALAGREESGRAD